MRKKLLFLLFSIILGATIFSCYNLISTPIYAIPAPSITSATPNFIVKNMNANQIVVTLSGEPVSNEWYINDTLAIASQYIDFSTTNTLSFTPTTSGSYSIYAKLDGVSSNVLNFEFYDVDFALTQTAHQTERYTFIIDKTFNLNKLPSSITSTKKTEISSYIRSQFLSVFGNTPTVVNEYYTLTKMSNGTIKYIATTSGAHIVNLVGIMSITMPNVIVAPIASIYPQEIKSVYYYGLDNAIKLTFNAPDNCSNIQWLIREPATSQYRFADKDNNLLVYTFDPSQFAGAGTYYFKVKYTSAEEIYTSAPFQLLITPQNHDSITKIEVKSEQVANSKNNITAFKFSTTNLSFQDPATVKWYVNAILGGTGLEFVLEPDYAGTYNVYAVISDGTSSTVRSEYISVDAYVNNIQLKLIIAGIALGVMTIFLIIGIILNIKNERIW